MTIPFHAVIAIFLTTYGCCINKIRHFVGAWMSAVGTLHFTSLICKWGWSYVYFICSHLPSNSDLGKKYPPTMPIFATTA